MKRLIFILLISALPLFCNAQQTDTLSTSQDTTCFTSEQVDNLYQGIRKLERSDSLKTQKIEFQEIQINQLNTQLSNYKDLVNLKNEHISLLEKRVELKDEKIGLLEKKIRRNKFKHLLTGAAGGVIIGIVVAL